MGSMLRVIIIIKAGYQLSLRLGQKEQRGSKEEARRRQGVNSHCCSQNVLKIINQIILKTTMPPKVDPTEVRIINIKVFGGEPGPAATLAPKLGPLGLNAKKVGEDIVKEGGKWKGIRVMVQLKCQNRAAEIIIQPTSSALLIKELGNYERDRKKVKNVTHKGNLTLEQVKKVAKIIEEKSMAKNFAGTVRQVLGTCLSLGCTVDKQGPRQVIAKINNGEIKV